MEHGEFTTVLSLYSQSEHKVHYVRPIALLDSCAGFYFYYLEGRRFARFSALSSMPMWSKYSRLRIDEIPMMRLHILLKEPQNRDYIKFLKDSITNSLNNIGQKDNYEIWSY